MCTSIHFKTKDYYFGRNLDLEYRFQEQVVITPRQYAFKLKNKATFHTKYAMIGMASLIDDYPLYAEACNEKGVGMAGLYFPDNAYYFQEQEGKLNLTPFELIPYLLGNCESILQIKAILADLNITNIPFSSSVPLTSLHWMISDEKQSIVIESMKDGLKIYDNPVGVLTNNPPFPYHLANLNNYLNVTSDYVENRFSNEIELSAYGVGMGAMGLPGDVSSSSRFVRAAFNKFNSVCDEDEDSSVAQFFHILDSVAMVKGCAKTKAGKVDMTTYSCCMNGKQNIYYYKTYTNNQITAIRMNEKEMNANKLSVFLLKEKEQIHYEN